MSPTLENDDRLIVNKLIYRLSVPQRDDIVMLYYPVNPDKSFVKRVIAKENDTVRIVDGKVYVNGEAREDVFVPPTYRSHEDFGSHDGEARLLLRHGRPPQQQLGQPRVGRGAPQVHHRQGPAALVAALNARAFSTDGARVNSRRRRRYGLGCVGVASSFP